MPRFGPRCRRSFATLSQNIVPSNCWIPSPGRDRRPQQMTPMAGQGRVAHRPDLGDLDRHGIRPKPAVGPPRRPWLPSPHLSGHHVGDVGRATSGMPLHRSLVTRVGCSTNSTDCAISDLGSSPARTCECACPATRRYSRSGTTRARMRLLVGMAEHAQTRVVDSRSAGMSTQTSKLFALGAKRE